MEIYHDRVIGESPLMFISKNYREKVKLYHLRRLLGDAGVPVIHAAELLIRKKKPYMGWLRHCIVYSDQAGNAYNIFQIHK